MQSTVSHMELLAPAGGMEQLQAAVRFGADAVYLSTDRFGMRARAQNFTLDTVSEALAYAHEHNVKVYVTCNVLMTPDDIDALPAYVCALDEAGVDALIVGDMGAFAVARENATHLDLHVSTQASVANAAAACAWHDLGAKRVVCAREMSLADIARMRQETPDDLEIEVFVHGAMCMAISGRCLISAYLTGRSGNQGHCTQPCRWSYTLEEEKRPGVHFPIEEDDRGTFILNAKDLNMIDHLDELARSGVNAIKIEGRNKKAFYVAGVVGAYRRVLNGEPSSQVADELEAVSHRPYGTGFYFGEAQQAPDFDGYEQQTLHVGDVLGCEPLGDADLDEDERRWVIVVRCRNRFAQGDALEILRPRKATVPIVVRDLEWLGADSPVAGKGNPEISESDTPRGVTVANRSCQRYRFVAEGLKEPVEEGSFLRERIYRRSARHE